MQDCDTKTAARGQPGSFQITENPALSGLVAEDVSKSYGKEQVLREVSFTLLPGNALGICGSNGSGKTPLILYPNIYLMAPVFNLLQEEDIMHRKSRHGIMPEIQTRFANRALNEGKLPLDLLHALLEAASFAPSCFNEQPWRFLVAEDERKEQLCACLTPKNQVWACRAPVLILVCAKKTFSQNGKDNRWHLYDTGCAVGFLILEAERRGLTAHPMAGFSQQKARETFNIPEELELITVVAVAQNGDPMDLSDADRERNHPSPRMSLEQLLL